MKLKCRLCELTVSQQKLGALAGGGGGGGIATCTHVPADALTPALGQLYHFAGFVPQLRDMMLAACLFRGYYQPAGPLITAHHGHAHPPPAPTGKAVPLPTLEASPSPTPPPTGHQPPPSSTGTAESSDNEVIITSASSGGEPLPMPIAPPAAAQAYRYGGSQYPATAHGPPGPGYPYSYPPPPPASQYYHSAPAGFGQQQHFHHELCYPGAAYLHPKAYAATFRRYIPPPPPPSQYYPAGPGPDLYSAPPTAAQSSQVVSAASSAAASGYQPPPVDTYAPPPPPVPPTIVEPYPPPHYYSAYGAGPAPPACYSHSPTRNLAFIDPNYSCPCPMNSCPKNVHTGPLTGDGKRSNVTTIAKESMPLPPVALALPLEPASVAGPPSPARGSAGMPPPPSPAGATYQPTVMLESKAPPTTATAAATAATTPTHADKRTKARLGKTMARNNITSNLNATPLQQHQAQGMLLMCHNPPPPHPHPAQHDVKREVESPEEVRAAPLVPDLQQKHERLSDSAPCEGPHNQSVDTKTETEVQSILDECSKRLKPDDVVNQKLKNEDIKEQCVPIVVQSVAVRRKSSAVEDVTKTEPCGDSKAPAAPAEGIGVKRKLSTDDVTENAEDDFKVQVKKQKPSPKSKLVNGSYKDLIKKSPKCLKINNGKRKLTVDSEIKTPERKFLVYKTPKIMLGGKSKKTAKRKQPMTKEEPAVKRMKTSKPLVASNLHNLKQNVKHKEKQSKSNSELTENKEPIKKCNQKKIQVNSKCNNNNSSITNVDRTIESVILNSVYVVEEHVRTSVKQDGVLKQVNDKQNTVTDPKITDSCTAKHETNLPKIIPAQCKTTRVGSGRSGASKRKQKPTSCPVALPVARIPRRSIHLPRWSNGWSWEGEPFEGKVFLNSDETQVIRKCYPSMRHSEGDVISPRDCVLLKAGPRKIDLPFVAKVAALWEDEDGEMMISLLWYYRPEHTEQGRRPADRPDEVFASRHKDTNSVACIEDKCYVLTFNEYCRYRKSVRRLEEGMEHMGQVVPLPEGGNYHREHRQPPAPLATAPDLVFFCRQVYDFRQKRIVKNPS